MTKERGNPHFRPQGGALHRKWDRHDGVVGRNQETPAGNHDQGDDRDTGEEAAPALASWRRRRLKLLGL
jgi:hypothetical protein